MRRGARQQRRGHRRRRWPRTSTSATTEQGASPNRGPAERRSIVAWSVAGLLVVTVVVAALLVDPDDGFEAGSEVLAWEACRGEVLGRLREPSSAVFPPATEASFRDEDPVWTVSAHVDADNTFGELVRERWVCTIRFGTSGARLVALELSPVVLD